MVRTEEVAKPSLSHLQKTVVLLDSMACILRDAKKLSHFIKIRTSKSLAWLARFEVCVECMNLLNLEARTAESGKVLNDAIQFGSFNMLSVNFY
jgi:hypothetical protein